ncbi:hypothetical protein [Pectobacterium phage Clickz_B7]|uniref:Uncharacterized protein n=1 Tax=Pectobacterium phage Clickz_B7 TaxID=2489624 RepID=A0A3G8FHW5_9CAUD|nr:hypothetical protein [Pectobacterium phage Clickz_B7]
MLSTGLLLHGNICVLTLIQPLRGFPRLPSRTGLDGFVFRAQPSKRTRYSVEITLCPAALLESVSI